MPNTRKKVIKTVYKNDDSDGEAGDFSDSGSDAQISEAPTSDDEEIEANRSSPDEFQSKTVKKRYKQPTKRKPKFAKELINKLNKQTLQENEDNDLPSSMINVKDLTDADKLLPSSLNLSESDSSDEEVTEPSRIPDKNTSYSLPQSDPSDHEEEKGYTDVWSNIHDNSAELAKNTFMELEQQKNTIEATKASLQSYVHKTGVVDKESTVKDLLALGEDVELTTSHKKKRKQRKAKDDSESEVEDWEEVKESKSIPQQGLQLVVALPDYVCRKTKKVDVEMMMKRKINRVKKENQVFMHKVHVLCWLGHGNFVSRVLNDQELMGVVHALVPKGCYPKDRLDMKYVEQITAWYKDKFILKPDKYENKYRPKAPPLKKILLDQIKKKAFTSKKYLVFVFVTMLRALGLQCRVMFNFVTVPLRPSVSELCSLSTKPKVEKSENDKEDQPKIAKSRVKNTAKNKRTLPQVDGVFDISSSDSDFENIMQVDGNNDISTSRTRSSRSKTANASTTTSVKEEGVSPPKRSKKESAPKSNVGGRASSKSSQNKGKGEGQDIGPKAVEKKKSHSSISPNKVTKNKVLSEKIPEQLPEKSTQARRTRRNNQSSDDNGTLSDKTIKVLDPPTIILTNVNQENTHIQDADPKKEIKAGRPSRKRCHTADVIGSQTSSSTKNTKTRNKSLSGDSGENSKYFDNSVIEVKKPKLNARQLKLKDKLEDSLRVSHRDVKKPKAKSKLDVTGDLKQIIKTRIKSAKEEAQQGIVKGKLKQASDEDSDYLPVEDPKVRDSDSDEDFKPIKIIAKSPKVSPGAKPSTSKKIDRRVFSTDNELGVTNANDGKKVDVWCEIFVEELEQWIAVDIVKGKVHCAGELYSHATHPVCYIVGWDNNNYLKDLTRRYVPQWNTVTRKQRAEVAWWQAAVRPWLGPSNARDREEDDALDRMQVEAPLPKSIGEYKNHPLYALKRHLLKFEAIYPADAATLGFVRNEPVYARDCVHVCRSRDIWLKEAKVVRLGETPYKVVKARPKWDRLSNKLITDKPLEVFGPWQVQDYEPPTAENGKVPRNAYGNVELFKECMLPKGTVHIKLPGLNKVARKLNIDCAPAMVGFDFNGGWSHPVYDGFVVCEEFGEIITEAWLKDQEEQERREREKLELRVYGNWKRLIKGLLIRERLKLKYGFQDPSPSQPKNKKGPRLVVKKKS